VEQFSIFLGAPKRRAIIYKAWASVIGRASWRAISSIQFRPSPTPSAGRWGLCNCPLSIICVREASVPRRSGLTINQIGGIIGARHRLSNQRVSARLVRAGGWKTTNNVRFFLDCAIFLVAQQRGCFDLLARSALPLTRWAHCHGYSPKQANRPHVVNFAVAVKTQPSMVTVRSPWREGANESARARVCWGETNARFETEDLLFRREPCRLLNTTS
jgi:hypothetical protein